MDILEKIMERAKGNPQRIVLPEGTEVRTLKAADIILKEKAARLILIGSEAEIRKLAQENGLDAAEIESLIDEVTNDTRVQEEQLEQERLEQERLEQERLEQEKLEESQQREAELQSQIEELKRQIEESKETIKNLEEKNVGTIQMVKMPTESKEELENRLEILKQRLKDNEKELSANRKEFAPLRRVNMTLDSDKRKLRRKEAIVAKQKVVLYGVNNYVDIDEEKAKKLSEELDLLEGLRLSVQHCEEVMQKNKDRYPILERANAFLVKNQAQLKEDIAEIERKLALLEEEEKENSSVTDVATGDEDSSTDTNSNASEN